MSIFECKKFICKISKIVTTDENYFQHPNWRIVTLLDAFSGSWPFQKKHEQTFWQIFHLFILSTMTAAVINRLRTLVRVNNDRAIECGIALIFFFIMLLKVIFGSVFRNCKAKNYQRVVEHFEAITDSNEAKVLQTLTDQGFKFIIFYVSTGCILVSLFDSIPNIRLLCRYFFYDDELKLTLPVEMDYGFDHHKYWYLIMIHFLTFFFSTVAMAIGFDMSFIFQVYHVQALLKIVRMRLKKASKLAGDLTINNDTDDIIYSIISNAVRLHSESLEMIDMIEKSYTITWFVIMLLNSACFGANIHLLSVNLHDPINLLRGIVAFVTLSFHFYVIFAQGQSIIDSSSKIFDACYDCQWYNMSKRSRKQLFIIMMRSLVPRELTGAQFFPLSIETFGNMYKGALSYYTLFEQ